MGNELGQAQESTTDFLGTVTKPIREPFKPITDPLVNVIPDPIKDNALLLAAASVAPTQTLAYVVMDSAMNGNNQQNTDEEARQEREEEERQQREEQAREEQSVRTARDDSDTGSSSGSSSGSGSGSASGAGDKTKILGLDRTTFIILACAVGGGVLLLLLLLM